MKFKRKYYKREEDGINEGKSALASLVSQLFFKGVYLFNSPQLAGQPKALHEAIDTLIPRLPLRCCPRSTPKTNSPIKSVKEIQSEPSM